MPPLRPMPVPHGVCLLFKAHLRKSAGAPETSSAAAPGSPQLGKTQVSSRRPGNATGCWKRVHARASYSTATSVVRCAGGAGARGRTGGGRTARYWRSFLRRAGTYATGCRGRGTGWRAVSRCSAATSILMSRPVATGTWACKSVSWNESECRISTDLNSFVYVYVFMELEPHRAVS